MLHPDTELRFINEAIGHGVFATRPLPKGTITWVRCPLDQVFTPDAVMGSTGLVRAVLDKYSFVDRRGMHILCWDLGRFVNHCCDANCLSPGLEFEVAIRDIKKGEQLTDDYGTLNIEESFDCLCGSPKCRGRVRPDDPIRLADDWDGSLASAFPLIERVKQPLWELVREPDEVKAILAGRQPLPTCRVNHAFRLQMAK